MKSRRLFVAGLLLASRPAARPAAYLEVREAAAGLDDLLWRKPVLAGMRLPADFAALLGRWSGSWNRIELARARARAFQTSTNSLQTRGVIRAGTPLII